MATKVSPDKREYALTILARMIVRAYLGEIDRGEAGPDAYREIPVRNRAVKPSGNSQKTSSDVQAENHHE